MDGGELQTVREFLGLTIESLAGMLRVNPRTIRSWEAGRDPIPARIRDEIAEIEAMTAQAVTELVDALRRDPVVAVYRRDEDMHAARPDTAHLPARWWRHVVARAAHEVPGVKIVKHRNVKYRNKEELIAAAREKGLYPPENATPEQLREFRKRRPASTPSGILTSPARSTTPGRQPWPPSRGTRSASSTTKISSTC